MYYQITFFNIILNYLKYNLIKAIRNDVIFIKFLLISVVFNQNCIDHT